MALRPALSSGLPFSSVQTLMMFLRPGKPSHLIRGWQTWGMSAAGGCKSKTRAAWLQLGGPLETYQNALDFSAEEGNLAFGHVSETLRKRIHG
jgi:hypothetical protein